MVAKCLETHLSAHRLHHYLQSAYLKVHHDIPEALDTNYIAALILLDLSAFDVIDYFIKIRLGYSLRVTRSALT